MKAKFVNESMESRGKTQEILDYIREAGPEGRRYTDIIRFAYELTYGPGSYDADTVPTETTTYPDGWKNRTGGNPHRGYWSGAFKTPSPDARSFGHLIKYITKNDAGRWILRDEKMSPDEAEQIGRRAQYGNGYPNERKVKPGGKIW